MYQETPRAGQTPSTASGLLGTRIQGIRVTQSAAMMFQETPQSDPTPSSASGHLGSRTGRRAQPATEMRNAGKARASHAHVGACTVTVWL